MARFSEEAEEKAWYFALRFMHFGTDEVFAEHSRNAPETTRGVFLAESDVEEIGETINAGEAICTKREIVAVAICCQNK